MHKLRFVIIIVVIEAAESLKKRDFFKLYFIVLMVMDRG